MSAARAPALRFYVGLAIVVLAIVAGIVLGKRSRTPPPPTVRVPPPSGGELADWCPELYEPIPGGCFAAPGRSAAPRGLLVYLHGRHAPEQVNEERERQSRVARLGTARGYAVLAFRGAQGECLDPRLATWWCWPSSERNQQDGPPFVARFEDALAAAEQRVGKGRRVLLGFSNGAYFAAMIARGALLPFDAIAIAHGGPVEPMHPPTKAPPLLLIDADDDPSGPEMDRLEADLAHESWPHTMVAREGGHALPEWDIDMALTFFDRTRTEPLPLTPPLSARPRRMHPPPEADAGDPEGPPSATAASATSTASATPPPEVTAEPSSEPLPSAAPAPSPDPSPTPPMTDPAPSE